MVRKNKVVPFENNEGGDIMHAHISETLCHFQEGVGSCVTLPGGMRAIEVANRKTDRRIIIMLVTRRDGTKSLRVWTTTKVRKAVHSATGQLLYNVMVTCYDALFSEAEPHTRSLARALQPFLPDIERALTKGAPC